MNGLFISFEGIDGAGKSTHIEGLAKAFRAQGRVVTVTREPGGTPLAEKLRTLVLNDAMDPMTEATKEHCSSTRLAKCLWSCKSNYCA